MKNCIGQTTTKLEIDRVQRTRLSQLVPSDKKRMITYGGGSLFKNVIYYQVKA